MDFLQQAEVHFCNGEDDINCTAEKLKLIQIFGLNIESLATEGRTPAAMWHSSDPKSDLIDEKYKWAPIPGGALDGVAEEVTSVPMIIKTVGELIFTDAGGHLVETLSTKKGWSKLGDAAVHGIVETITDPEKAKYVISKGTVQIAMAYIAIARKSATSVKEAMEEAGDLAEKLENAPVLERYLARIVKESPDAAKVKSLQKLLEDVDVQDVEKLISKLDESHIDDYLADISGDLTLAKKMVSDEGLVDSWKRLDDLGEDIIPASLRTDPSFLGKFDDVAKNNNLGLDADGVSDLLKSPSTKVDAVTGQPLKWDNPDGVLDAIRRTSDSGVDGVSISHKKFPTPGDGSDPFVLKNAKQYQAEASGDAGLSFDKNGVSFDNVDDAGILVDRKYGHSSVFNADGTVANQTRANSILEQAKRQLGAVGNDGTKIRWEISSEGGANGIEQLFLRNTTGIQGLEDIEVVHIAQKTIIN